MFNDYKSKVSFLLSDLNELFLTHSLQTFAFSLAGLFIPIFLLHNNFSFMQVLLYLLVFAVIVPIVYFFFLKIASSYGIKLVLGFGLLLMILFFTLLNNLDYLLLFISPNQFILLIAVSKALAGSCYWSSFQLALSTKTSSKKIGKDTSVYQSLSMASSILAPFFGGLLIVAFSYQFLFTTSLFILVLAIIPLFFVKNEYDSRKIFFKDFIRFDNIREGLPYFAEGFHHFLVAKLWPVFLFFVAINVKDIGAFYTLSNFLVVLFTIYAGRMRDTINYFKIMRFGAVLHSFTIAFRVFFRNLYFLASVQGLGGISWALLTTNYTADFLESSKERGRNRTIYERELYLNLGRIFLISIGALLFHFIRDPLITLTILFIIGSLSPLIMLLEEKNLSKEVLI